MHRSDAVNLARAGRTLIAPPEGSARAELIATAERLFAEHGIEGVSLRTICAESNQGNTRALQYHFKDRQGIVAAILLTRMAEIERRRTELLDAITDPPDLADLMDILLRPIGESVASDGRNLFARFLLHVTTHSSAWGWGRVHTIEAADTEVCATQRAYDMLETLLAPLPASIVQKRMGHVLRMFLGALIDRENTLLDGGNEASLAETIEEQIAMAAAALQAPDHRCPGTPV